MKTLNCIITELKKVIISPYFAVGIIAFALMCFTSSAYTDYSNMKQISIFEMMTMLGTDKAESYEFSAQYICAHGFGMWVVQFLSIIVAFPLVFLDISQKAEDVFVQIEITTLIIGIVFFAWCIKHLLFMISKLKTEK